MESMHISSNWQRVVYKFSTGCILLFLTFSTMAMFVYPGGTLIEPQMARYAFMHNFFSDLGRTTTFTGQPNTASYWLFFLALSVVALGLIAFFFAMPFLFKGSRGFLWANFGSLCGVITALAYFGIALTPWDLAATWHFRFVKTAFLSFLPAILCYSIAIWRNGHYPRLYGWVFIFCGFILLGYLWLLFFGPDIKTPMGLLIQVLGQKVIVYTEISCIAIQLFGAQRHLQQTTAHR